MSPQQKTVLVIGSGLAGLSAALQAAEMGDRVTIVEKNSRVGGNSAKASSGMNVASGKEDIDKFIQDTLQSGKGLANPDLVTSMIENSQSSLEWILEQGKQENLDLSFVLHLGGHSAPRTRRNPKGPNVGFAIIKALNASIERNPMIELKLNTRVTSLLSGPDGRVIGAEFDDQSQKGKVFADSTILATGGFGASKDMLKEHAPGCESYPTTNGDWATGDGLTLAEGIGVEMSQLDQVQIHPTGFVDPTKPDDNSKWLAPEALRGSGGILLNAQGDRFVNELSTRDRVVEAIRQQTGKKAYLLLSKTGADMFGSFLYFYASKKLAEPVTSIDDVAARLQVDSSKIRDTIAKYDTIAKGELDDEFNKTVFPTSFGQDAFPGGFVMEVVPVIHYCMGGVAINTNAQVLTKDTKMPIPGLFAAGEITGGVHGGNRLGGNSLLECVTFGRIAARQAAQFNGKDTG